MRIYRKDREKLGLEKKNLNKKNKRQQIFI